MTDDGEGPITEEQAKAKVAELDAAPDDDVDPPPEPLEGELTSVDTTTEGDDQ